LTPWREEGGMDRRNRNWPVPRLTVFAWWWLATRIALPILATTSLLDLVLG
jgi:hypothetical protein